MKKVFLILILFLSCYVIYNSTIDNKIYYVVRMNEINKVCYYTHTDINMNNITKEIAEL